MDVQNKNVNCKLYSNRAIVYAKLGQLEKSIQDCDSALEIDSEFLKVIIRRADNCLRLERFEDAVKGYEKAFSLDQTNRGTFTLRVYM